MSSSLKGAFLLVLITTIVLSSSHPSSSAIAAAEESTESLHYPDTIIDNAQEEDSSSSTTITIDYVADNINPAKKKNSRQASEERERNLEHDSWWPTYSPTEVCLTYNFCSAPFVNFSMTFWKK